MTEKFELEWIFQPPDFFEQKIEVADAQFTLELEAGLAKAVVNATIFDGNSEVAARIERSVKARLDAQKLVRHKPYQLGNSVQKRVDSGGNVHTLIFAEMVEVLYAEDRTDGVVRSADGTIIGDTYSRRLAADKAFGDQVTAHDTDPLLAKLLSSFAKAVDDPNNELVHLYEIREALATTLGGETKARAALNVSKAGWSKLGSLCNNEPLKQARHRGKDLSGLRDATASELHEARAIARSLLDGYLSILDKSPLPATAGTPPPVAI